MYKHMLVSCSEGILMYKIPSEHQSILCGNACLFLLYKNMLFNLGANVVI